ncbi:MAG: 50S ribosomal protein L11 methyltransferase, partial [Hyphomicrobiaceae bacterium]
MRIEYHRTLVADQVRNAAFHAALKAVIVPGETIVADIGAGTGLLGLMAAQLGARQVFMYETAEVGGLAQDLLKLNEAHNCLLLPCHSTEMERPPRVDVVVSETLGNYPLEEDIVA